MSDGDINPEWSESFTSVLEDNSVCLNAPTAPPYINNLLTMPSRERIQFGLNVNFEFISWDP